MTTINGSTPYGLLTVLLSESQSVSQSLAKVTEQSASGLIAQTYDGLGEGSSVALNLQPQIATQTTLGQTLQTATGPLSIAQTGLTQINTLVSNITSELNNLNNLNASEVTSVAADAQSALQQVAGILDSQDGSDYIFAGQDSANAPVPNPDSITSSNFYSAISSAVSGLGTNGAAAALNSVLATGASTAAGTSPFSTTLEQLAAGGNGRIPIQTGSDASVPGVMLANQNGDITSTGTTTGSYIRDILTGLASIGSLTSASTSASGYQSFVASIRTLLTNANAALSEDQGVLGNRQTSITNTASLIADSTTALTTQVANVTDVDMAETATKLSLLQTQLQASYQLIAQTGSLSLVNYL